MHPIRRLAVTIALTVAACTGSGEDHTPTVLAAASMQEALTEAADRWEAQGHTRPALSFAATSALARQIESGAPADIFVSADEQWMDRIEANGLVREGTRQVVAANSLVLIANGDCPPAFELDNPADLDAMLADSRIAIAEPESVPAGRYAKAALEHQELWDGISGRIAPRENVRAALALVESGQVPLGVVYRSDAEASRKVCNLATFPAGSYPPIRYPAAVLETSQWTQAEAFLAFLASDEARIIFEHHGLAPAR